MGYNTSLIVLNDAIDMIRDDPEFGRRIYDTVLKLGDPRLHPRERDIAAHSSRGGVHCNAASVIETHHADTTTVVAFGGNSGTILHNTYGWEHHTPEGKERLVREMARDLGYNLVRNPRLKPRSL